ncbi:MAG TPA: DUF1800 domain-containing protein [Acidimicrobiales bacterium]|nr:DUF1800 domain-containing protein [Acidimicrobiales bacterium]
MTDEGQPQLSRRQVAAGAVGAGAVVVAAAAGILPGTRGTGNPFAGGGNRAAANRPSDAGGFGSQDESYASADVGDAAVAPPPTLVYATAGEAAAGTAVTVPTILRTDDPALHLARRATFGPTPELVDEIHAAGIDAWIAAQLAPDDIPDPVADQAWAAFPLAAADPATIRASIGRYKWDAMMAYSKATLARQVWSTRQLFEVMVDFWANHLNLPTPGPGGWDIAGSYHTNVIRAHALGSFTDMLLASAAHPAMLRYLSAGQSTRESVNENYGRELLELHTVGVGSGYTEDDVRNSAYILTGRTVVGDRGPGEESTFRYDPAKHWTGRVTVLDFSHDNASPEGGMEVGDAYLRHLAAHPATAAAIARKLAVRFVADMPPPSLVDRLTAAYLDGGTAIAPLLDTLFRSAEFWAAVGQKTRRPLENVVASARAVGVQPGDDTPRGVDALYWASQLGGQRPLAWPAPNGYPDVQAAWRSAGGLLEMWNNHRGLVGGWHKGLAYPPPEELVAGLPAATVGEHIDSLCQRLCFQSFQPAHRDALVAFVGADAAAPAGRNDVRGPLRDVAALVLDSPYFMLR